VTVMRKQCHCAFRIGLLAILLLGSMAVQPGFAKSGKSTGRVLAKSAARPSESGAKQPPQGENQGPGKADIAHIPVTRDGDKLNDIETRITVQPRRLGKSLNPNIGHANALSFARNPYHPRTLSALPRVPYSPVRNAIGLPISPRASLGPGDGLHPTGLRPVRPLVSPAVPNSATGRVVAPHPTPSFVSPSAINGTGLASRHQGPPQIGRPSAVAGINGTTIKPVR
jgi:hypothetical protein